MTTKLTNRSNIYTIGIALLMVLFFTSPPLRGNTLSKPAIITKCTLDANITGTVTSVAEGVPLIGASVVIKGTSFGTVSDIDGQYSIEAKEGDVLVFSYTGYTTQEVSVGRQTTIDIALSEDAELLDEVVVVGYGTRKKSHNTGAIASIDGGDVAAIQANRVDDALAGKLAGVLIQNQDGAPGADPKIQIRAASSISGDSNPLIVVDGYPISGSLATVNPNDIESLEVLKDAASAAIYGSRGANGVILVTTKKGKSGKASFSYNAYVSTSQRYVRDNINPTASEWADIIETNINNGTFDIGELDKSIVDYRLNAYKNSPDVVAVEDWLFQNGMSMNHDFSISGGTDDVNYFASVGYLNTEGIVRTQAFERYNARLNVNAKLGERFRTGLNFNGFLGDRDIEGHDQRDLLRAYSVHPIYHTEASIAFV
ncbi:MAG: SusC/RagA family TonB-linked outer membrane protein, partial [Bacteroidota bacterium]